MEVNLSRDPTCLKTKQRKRHSKSLKTFSIIDQNMSNYTITQILGLPDKCPVAQIQGRVTAAFEIKQINNKPKQDFILDDASGVSIRVSLWGHNADASFYKGKEVILQAGPKGGLSVNVYQGKVGLNMSATCTFQLLAVHQAQTGAPVQQPIDLGAGIQVSVTGDPSAPKPINGVTIGMAINNSCQSLTAMGEPLTKKRIWELASMVVRVSQHMEKGNLSPLAVDNQPLTQPVKREVTGEGVVKTTIMKPAEPANELQEDQPF